MRAPLLVLLLLVIPVYANAEPSACASKDGAIAEDAIAHVHDWDDLYRAFPLLKKCDDGGTAEGSDDLVITLFAMQWPTSHHPFDLMRKTGTYRSFVLNHISATGDLKALKKVRENALKRCVQGEQELCDMIAARAKIAIDTLVSDGIT